MKKSIIIANWKMKLLPKEELNLAKNMADKLKGYKKLEMVICPSFVGLSQVAVALNNSNILLGAQDVFWQKQGAYTGEVSTRDLEDVGCQYVIIGHSERRQILKETDKMINKKIKTCLESDLIPIICVGETREEKQSGMTDNVISRQLTEALAGIDLIPEERIVIAYEPVWAIGSGNEVNPDELTQVLGVIRRTLIDLWPGFLINESVSLIYGGSIDSDNIKNFDNVDLLDGFLVGGASLKIDEFISVVKSLKQ